MTNKELVRAVADISGHSVRQVTSILSALYDKAGLELQAGRDVTLGELGKLKIQRREGRPARNPRTGETVQIPARNVVKFVPAKALREAV